MPLMANITVNNGEPTPVAQEFVPNTNDGKTATWVRTGATSVQNLLLTLSTSKLKLKGPYVKEVSKISGAVRYPITSVIDGVTVEVASCYGSFQFAIPDVATMAHKQDIEALLANAIQSAFVKDVVENGSAIRG